ncbi:MAG: DUF2339 domain-containing protein [Dermatophilaceae bacterium]|jgi:hypothetical protein
MTGDETTRDELRHLEESFAEAMTRLYAVGNGLARLRHDLEAGQTGPDPRTTSTSQPMTVPAPTRVATSASAGHGIPPVPLAPGMPAGPAVPAAGATWPATAAAAGPAPIPQVPASSWSPPVAAEEAAPTTALGRWWRRESLVTRLLGITGAVVTLVGLVMLLVLAVQQRWFGPVPRVVLGVLLAAALIGLAHVVHARERSAGRAGLGAVALAGTGYAAAYLDVVAITSIYGWVPPLLGLVLAIAVAGTGLLVARRWDSQVLAILILLGAAALLPAVAGRASWLLSAFMVVLAVASWPAQWGREWPAVTAARLIPATLVIVPTIGFAQQRPEEPWAHVAVTGIFAFAGMAMSVREARGRGFDTSALTILVTALPLLMAFSATPQPWRTVLLLLAAVAWLGYAALGESQRWLPVGTCVAATAAGTLALLLAIVARADTTWMGTALLVAALGYLLVAASTRSRQAAWWGLGMAALALLVYLRHPVRVLVQRTALESDLAVTLIDSAIAVGVILALAWLAHRLTKLSLDVRRAVAVGSWVAGLAIATTAVVSVGVLLGRSIDSAVAGFRAGHAVATILWMVAAAWLLIRGLRRSKDADLAMWTGLGLAAGAVAKLFLYDLAVLAGIWRVVAFMVVGLILLGTGAGYAKALERARAADAVDPDPGAAPLGTDAGPAGPEVLPVPPTQMAPAGTPVPPAPTAPATPPPPPGPPGPSIPPIPPVTP